MAAMFETPSRVLRRIQAIEAEDLPSLPSLPGFEDSADHPSESNDTTNDDMDISLPVHSTPALSNHTYTVASTIRAPSSASSTARFAHSITSRSTKSALSASRGSGTRPIIQDSFDMSAIPSLPDVPSYDRGESDMRSTDQEIDSSVQIAHRTQTALDGPGAEVDADKDLSEALQLTSRPNSPLVDEVITPSKKYDFSVSLRSEPKPSPLDKMRHVEFRRPMSRARARTPSLTHTTPSTLSSSSHSTPSNNRSISYARSAAASPLSPFAVPLPRSGTASPQVTQVDDEVPQTTSEEEVEQTLEPTESLDAVEASEPDLDNHREPTFSSEEALTQSEDNNTTAMQSPIPLSIAMSSPAPSAVFTPTPVFQARPRARSAQLATTAPQPRLLLPSNEHADDQVLGEVTEEHEDGNQEFSTPHAHKRSFLLSVINSTARPRMKYNTPHPHRTDGGQQAQSQAQLPMTRGVNLRAAFAGVTPRPQLRPRLSHPLTKASGPSESESASGSEAGTIVPLGAQSPYDPTVERASFVSTASSQDLTTHARANASFDVVMGLGEHGHGVGRFNDRKLNNYLHGLNRRFQEENEALAVENRQLLEENDTLVIRLKEYEEKYGAGAEGESVASPAASQPRSRRSSAGRRVSVGPGLGDVAEDAEEKAALEEMVEQFKEKLERCKRDKEQADAALLTERTERMKDKDRYKERMGEVEKGVERIVKDLEQKTEEAQLAAKNAQEEKVEMVKVAQKQMAVMKVEKEVLTERVERSEEALRNGKELGGELNASNERVAQLMGDLKNANSQMTQLENEVMSADNRIDELEKELQEERRVSSGLEEELQNKSDELVNAQQRLRTLEDDIRKVQDALRDSKAYIVQLDADAGTAVQRAEILQEDLAAAEEKIIAMASDAEQDKDEIDRLIIEADRASELARQMEAAIEAAEGKMLADEQEVVVLKAKVNTLERALEREQERSRSQAGSSHSQSTKHMQDDIDALEQELNDAHKQIARLTTMLSQSPARKAIVEAKDKRIEMLEKENDDLLDRIKSLRANTFSGTPGPGNKSFSPLHRQILSMKSPKTPGGPLRDLSWLQSSTQDPTVSPLLQEIVRLKHELDRANDSIDDKIDQLEDADLGVVGLTKQVEDARERVVSLEDEVGRMSRKEARRDRRLSRARCRKCRTKFDLHDLDALANADESSTIDASDVSLATEPATPPTKTSEALRASLEAVNAQLASMKVAWEEEKRKLLGEKAVLQNAANKLNLEVRDAKNELQRVAQTERAGDKARADIKSELNKARRVIDDLETELESERARLRTLTTEQNRGERERDEVALQLRRMESDMADVREHLQRIKQENHNLEAELRTVADAEQKARLLEKKVAGNAEMIEQLRQERSLLSGNYKELQRRYSQVSENMNKLRDQHAASQSSHDNRRHQLDEQLLEVEELRRALSDQAEELLRAESEKNRMAAEKSGVAHTVSALEEDLRRVRKDAEAFGRDLKLLRAQKDRLEEERKQQEAKAERAQKQSQTQIRVLKEELEAQRQKANAITKQLKEHLCPADEEQLAAIQLQHNRECKGLIVQIRYLKAKFVREATLRCDLGYQKQYLLVLLTRLERNEKQILSAIAKIGFPAADPPAPVTRKRTLKSIVCVVVFILRSKNASDSWREQRASKDAIMAALQEVRMRRTVKPGEKE